MARPPAQSDREALARALAKRQQLGWQASSVAWAPQPLLPADPIGLLRFGVDQGLGQIDLEDTEDTIPWVVTLKPWFRDPNTNTPEGPLSGRMPGDFIRAKVTYGAGALGPQAILVDWPGAGTSFIVNGSSIKVGVLGQARFPIPNAATDINRLPRNFGAFVSPARGHGASSFQAPTFTEERELSTGLASQLIPVPSHATAVELHCEWERIVAARLRCIDDATGGVRTTTIHYRDASAPDPAIAVPTWGTPVRLPWWCRQIGLDTDATEAIVLTSDTTVEVATAFGGPYTPFTVLAGTYTQASLAAILDAGFNAGNPGATFTFVAGVARIDSPVGSFEYNFTPPAIGTPAPANELADILGFPNQILGNGPRFDNGSHIVTTVGTAANLIFHLTP